MEERKERHKQLSSREVNRLQEEHGKVVSSCQEKIQHWKKVESDYDALQDRLSTLPDKLSYDILVPFGPLAFMPGKLVQTNEITVLLGDNWFAKCSAKQAMTLVDHRKKHVKKALDDLHEVVKNFESRVDFTKDLQRMSDEANDFFDIREEANEEMKMTKGKHRQAHKPHSKPKAANIFESDFREDDVGAKSEDGAFSNKELWARLEELEREEELQGELHQISKIHHSTKEFFSEEDDKENRKTDLNVAQAIKYLHTQGNENTKTECILNNHINGSASHHSDEEDDSETSRDFVATIHFHHTVEPKRVRINTGKNTTLKYSEKKEEAKRKRKNSNGNGYLSLELPKIKTPADIYRAFVDIVNGEYVPRKSIMKSRSRENSVCSDTSESSAPEYEDRRSYMRNVSYEENIFSDHSDGFHEEEDRTHKKLSPVFGPLEAFSGTVVEKEPFSMSVPITSIAHPGLPTIQEWKSEELSSEVSEESTKRVSKFKAARIQQHK
ncbi:unconventional prefoldin RPB5 interactor 1 [Bombina bombina]|uniref:unconventional prefoldin RPB5 interactor 1 n=1 Tax=Bombina bombina TaxID=8345 RepID=UPI00235ADFBF|nr:unconventional prefoldin RPB5 interactor 1 [Bombina bombina]